MTIVYTDTNLVSGMSIDSESRRNPYVTGYGGMIPTAYRIRYAGYDRRVYAMCYGNSASLYLRVKGSDHFLDIDTEHKLDAFRNERA